MQRYLVLVLNVCNSLRRSISECHNSHILDFPMLQCNNAVLVVAK